MRTKTTFVRLLLAAGLAQTALIPARPATAAKFELVHSFSGGADGAQPGQKFTADSQGNLFGVATYITQTLFELKRSPTGSFAFKTLRCDCFGQRPQGALIADTQGNLYGTDYVDGNGYAFELVNGGGRNGHGWGRTNLAPVPAYSSTLIYAGSASGAPYDGHSPLYAVSYNGGIDNAGTVYSLTSNNGQWTTTVLYEFCSGGFPCPDGDGPAGAPVLDPSGNILGTTAYGGGANDAGVVFKLSWNGSSWVESVLYDFCSAAQCKDGSNPFGDLVADAAGNLLGTATAGGDGAYCPSGTGGCGAIFKVVPDGAAASETVLYAFCRRSDCADGRAPQSGVLLDASGNLFGTTYYGGGHDIDRNGKGGGVAFRLSGSSLKVLHSFCSLANCADGEYPWSDPYLDSSGKLFGTTISGGSANRYGGTIFQIQMGP
jgi:hypothetical protein